MTDKIIELQTKLAHQDHTIEELIEALSEHQKRIDDLENQLRSLQDKLNKEELVRKIEDEEKPPHY